MFDLDIYVLNFIYQRCVEMGHCFSCGALGGLVIYGGIIAGTIVSTLNRIGKYVR